METQIPHLGDRHMKHIQNLAIIPARGGSKGVPRKNILPIAGIPLIAHTIIFLQKINLFDKIIVSTDDKEIAEIANKYGIETVIRPSELASDTSLVIDAVRYTILKLENDYKIDYIFLFEPTSPIRKNADIEQCVSLTHLYHSVASISPLSISPNRMFISHNNRIFPLIEDAKPWLPRQKQPIAYRFDGIFYGFSNQILKEKLTSSVVWEETYPYIISYENIDIDTQFDFFLVKTIIETSQDEEK